MTSKGVSLAPPYVPLFRCQPMLGVCALIRGSASEAREQRYFHYERRLNGSSKIYSDKCEYPCQTN
jgi:hypothetical protein